MNKLEALKKIRSKLNNGGFSLGSWIQLESSSSAEILSNGNYDWLTVDLEHGSISISQLPDIFRAIELNNTLPLVRLSEGTPVDCKRALDAGAGGVIIPKIETSLQLDSIINSCRWPPNGDRGVGFSRANLYGDQFDKYKEEAAQPFIVAMIESKRALENIDEILSVSGLDAILVGPYDLSASLGFTGEINHPLVENSIKELISACKTHQIPAGIHIVKPDIEELKIKIKNDYQFIAYSIDTVFLNFISKNPIINI